MSDETQQTSAETEPVKITWLMVQSAAAIREAIAERLRILAEECEDISEKADGKKGRAWPRVSDGEFESWETMLWHECDFAQVNYMRHGDTQCVLVPSYAIDGEEGWQARYFEFIKERKRDEDERKRKREATEAKKIEKREREQLAKLIEKYGKD